MFPRLRFDSSRPAVVWHVVDACRCSPAPRAGSEMVDQMKRSVASSDCDGSNIVGEIDIPPLPPFPQDGTDFLLKSWVFVLSLWHSRIVFSCCAWRSERSWGKRVHICSRMVVWGGDEGWCNWQSHVSCVVSIVVGYLFQTQHNHKVVSFSLVSTCYFKIFIMHVR